MSSLIHAWARQSLLPSVPSWLPNSVIYEATTGSHSYGTANEDSDQDLVAIVVPPRYLIWPPQPYIEGFGKPREKFEQYQPHGVKSFQGELFDLTAYSVVKFFDLAMQNNPNIVDVLFVDDELIRHITAPGALMRQNRKMFLHKGCWHKFKGYAYSQLKKMDAKEAQVGSKRYELVQKFGYDTKFAAHTVRLMLEVEQILAEGDLDLRRHSSQLRAIRAGEWSQGQVRAFFSAKEVGLEKLYLDSKLPYGPDEDAIRELLMQVIALAYGENRAVMSEEVDVVD